MADPGPQFTPIDHKTILKGMGDGRTQGARQYGAMVRNIVRTHDAASPEHRQAGEEWYSAAWDHANALSKQFGIEHRTAAGVIAALSPQKGWETNKYLADQFLRTGSSGHTKQQNSTARKILYGADPHEVLNTGTAHKTFNFYHNMEDPEHPHYVTVDRHAHDIAVNQTYGDDNRGLGAKGRYGVFADAYRSATQHVNERDGKSLVPNQMQAITWTHWRGSPD